VDKLALGSLSSGRYTTNNSRFATTGPLAIRGGYNTFRFVISDDAPSASTLSFTLAVTDDKGDSWSMPVEFKVE